MCGRYFIEESDADEELQLVIAAINRRDVDQRVGLKCAGEVFPTDVVPVIANSRSLRPAVFAMQWGYALDGKTIINARSETAASRPLFCDGMAQRRCLIPASNYFEWERRGKERVKYAIRPTAREAMYMAGIYRILAGRPEFLILTREPTQSIAFIHDRMPVMLPAAALADWLDPRRDAQAVLDFSVSEVTFRPAA